MVQLPSDNELATLKATKEPHSLSMYLQFSDTTSASGPSRIEFKNALQAIEAQLSADGVDKREIETTLKPAYALIDNRDIWMPNHGGLVVFARPGALQYYFVPNHLVEPMVYVGEGFMTEPLERIMRDNREYYVLTLSRKKVQVYKGDRYHLEPLEITNFANNLRDSLMLDEPQKERGLHAVAPAAMGKGSEVPHEQYEVSREQKQMLLTFFRNIDKRLKNVFNKERAPLVIGGVEYLVPIYRRANTYNGLVAGAISGNLEQARPDDIRQKAWQIVSGVAS